jgi:predicted RNase H-like nuclease (RuvC/YqgF family)
LKETVTSLSAEVKEHKEKISTFEVMEKELNSLKKENAKLLKQTKSSKDNKKEVDQLKATVEESEKSLAEKQKLIGTFTC